MTLQQCISILVAFFITTIGVSAVRLQPRPASLVDAKPGVAAHWLSRAQSEPQQARVVRKSAGLLSVEPGDPPGGASSWADVPGTVAWASYVPQASTRSNFGHLKVESSSGHDDVTQLRAMGMLEGFLTAEAIHTHRLNMDWYLKQSTHHEDKLTAWLAEQRSWTEAQLAAHATKGGDAFWDMQALIWGQLHGILDGYAARAKHAPNLEPLSFAGLHLLNTFGDIDDLLNIIEQDWALADAPSAATDGMRLHPKWSRLTPHAARAHIAKSGRCSALIKVTSDLSDILMGHTTWWSYSSLLRVYKHYVTHLTNPSTAAQRLSFSSYPGIIHSLDDFMISDAGLVMMETSNDVYDLSLYRLSTNQAALSWQRSRAAMMLSADGPTFAAHIQRCNSGTYNNQYMAIDLKRFTPGQQLQSGLLTVVETLPGGAYVADTTQELERGYWPSYNIPYFNEVYNRTGYPEVSNLLRSRGPEFQGVAAGLSYQVSSRAKIFRRDSGDIKTLADMKRLLRSNGWSEGANADPYSPSPWEAICARGDLDPQDPDASGCYDAKVTNYQLAMRMEAEAVNGPTWDGDGSRNGHPAFAWQDWERVAHAGMIDVYDTVFELQAP